jgi:hypothetical protein
MSSQGAIYEVLYPSNIPCKVSHVRLSNEELQTGYTHPSTIQASLQQIHDNGLLILENAIQEAILDEVHEQMIADHRVLMSWPGARFNQGTSYFNISQTPPLVPELFYEEIYSNRHMMAILQNVIGPRPQLGLLTSNFALSSGPSDRQAVHTGNTQLLKSKSISESDKKVPA